MSVPLAALAAYSPDDAFNAYVEETVRKDSNVFNEGDSLPASSENGHKDSLVATTRAFLHYHYLLSRQRFYVESTLSRTDYTRFSAVDYNGWNNTAGWNWSLGRSLEGVVGYTDSRSLAEFNNLSLGQGDLLRSKTLQSTTQYSINSNLQLLATTSSEHDRHDQLTYLDLDASGRGAGVIVSLDKGGSMTLRYDATRVAFREDFLLLKADQRGYDQDATMLSADYPVSEDLDVSANASIVRIKQKSDGSTVRNTLSGAEVKWRASPRLRLSAKYQRKYDAPGSDTSATLTTTKLARIDWQQSPKLRFSAQRYVGNTDFGALSQGGERDEQITSDRAEIGWTPRNSMTVTLYGQHLARTSPLESSEFHQNQIGAGVRVNY